MLFIDDEENILKAVKRLFVETEYKILTALSGKEGLDYLRNEKVNVLVTDQRMPGMTGLDVIREALKIAPNTIMIILTAYSDIDVTIAAINDGHIYKYIVKPWDDEEFKTIIEEAIELNIRRDKTTEAYVQTLEYKEEIDRIANKLRNADFKEILAIADTVEYRDNYTIDHCRRMTEHVQLLADKLSFTKEQRDALVRGAVLHDIGKITIPVSILNKAGPLTFEEYTIIKHHSLNGAEITSRVYDLNDITPFILEHHEHYDGKGYSHGMEGDEITREGRIIAIADAFDAMTNNRPYRSAMTCDRVLEILESEKGRQFDPDLTDMFIQVVREKNT